MDDFSNVNETRIKVLSSYPSRRVEVRFSVGKKNIVVKNIALRQWNWKAVEKAGFNKFYTPSAV